LITVALLPFQVHLRFTFKHRSRNEAKEKQGPTPWALAYLKLVNDTNGTTVKDGYHDLLVYKVPTVHSQKLISEKFSTFRFKNYEILAVKKCSSVQKIDF
jgi:hypothetical protein